MDLRTEFQMQMRDQGDVSWCYAHAAADYLQFHHRIPEQISAADIAIVYNHRFWPRFLRWFQGGLAPETGFIRTAMYDISETGYCSEEFFPSDRWVKRIVSGKNADQTEMVPLAKAFLDIKNLVSGIDDGFYEVSSDLPYVYEFKGMTQQQFSEVIFEASYKSVLDDLRMAACDRHRKGFPTKVSDIRMQLRNSGAFSQINRMLDQRSPVSVDFFYGVLENKDSYRRMPAELHTALVIGRRFDSQTQECQYLIKNSYGSGCSGYDRRHSCENGNVWVGESSLYSAMTSFVYMN